MILLFNVFITETPGNKYLGLDRGNLENFTKLEITKYSLYSLKSCFPWEKVIINVELDSSYYTNEQKCDFKKFVENLFINCNLVYSTTRAIFQTDWKRIYELINDDFILYLGNHDHVFIDNSPEYLCKIVEDLKKCEYEFPTVPLSHWPEFIRSYRVNFQKFKNENKELLINPLEITSTYISYDGICIDSFIIISKKLYKNWFCEGVWGSDVRLPRTEGVGLPTIITIKEKLGIKMPIQRIFIPYKELFRHFDGYMHQGIDNNTCPSLDIPYGFLESKMKIRFGFDDYKKTWVNSNVFSLSYYAFKKSNSCDYKFTNYDYPFFWKQRIIEKHNNDQNLNLNSQIKKRISSVLDMVYSDYRFYNQIDPQVQKNIILIHLKPYPLDEKSAIFIINNYKYYKKPLKNILNNQFVKIRFIRILVDKILNKIS